MKEQPIFQDARQYLAMLHKRRSLLVACVGVSLLAATVYNYTTRPLFRATAQLLIDPSLPDVLPGRDLLAGMTRGREYRNTQYQLLAGRNLAEQVVERLRLQSSPEFQAGPILSPWERLRERLLGPQENGSSIGLSPAIRAFRSRLSVEPLPQSNLVNLRFAAYDPEIAAAAANALAEAYIRATLTLRSTTTSEATSWLGARLGDQRGRIEQAEQALQAYEEREGMVNLEEREQLVEQKLETLHGALMEARTERMAKETLYNEIAAVPRSELEAYPLVMNNGLIQGLRGELAELERDRRRRSGTLGERHPDMLRLQADIEEIQAKIEAETGKLVRSLENGYGTALRQEENLQASLEPVQREMQEIKRKAVEYRVLKREVEANQQLFKNLMNRNVETGLEGELEATNLRIVERAEVPGSPFSPRRARNYQLALLLGLALGLGLVFVVEQMDNSVKTPEDVKESLDLPFLGMIPDWSVGRSQGEGPGSSPLILKNPRSSLAEAYRLVRTNLIFSSPDTSHRVLLVSSVNPAEGKSTTAVNVAASLALNGARVLVVDADLRRPTLAKHFEVSSAPGLSDLIVGSCELVDAVRETQFKGLDVIPSGYLPPTPAELLGSARMRSFLRSLPEEYEWVLVDAPPVLAIADAPVLSTYVDGMILVIAAEKTARPAVQRTIDQVRAVGGKLVGVVLNKVNLERNAYYFGQYYGEYYRSYYTERGEGERSVPSSAASPGPPGRA